MPSVVFKVHFQEAARIVPKKKKMLKEESRLDSKECRQEICPSPSLVIVILYTAHFLFFFFLKIVLNTNEGHVLSFCYLSHLLRLAQCLTHENTQCLTLNIVSEWKEWNRRVIGESVVDKQRIWLFACLLILFSLNQKCQSLYQEREPLVRWIVDTKVQNAGFDADFFISKASKKERYTQQWVL